MINIDEYKQAVSSLASRRINFNIRNEGDDFAKVIFANIFQNATRTVHIVANSLRNSVVDSKEYLDSLDSFLGRDGAILQIILSKVPENLNEESSENIFCRLRRHPAYDEGRITIKDAKRDRFFIKDTPVHFCVADAMMYRIEDDIAKRTALCNFNDPIKAKQFDDIFKQGFESITDVVDLTHLF